MDIQGCESSEAVLFQDAYAAAWRNELGLPPDPMTSAEIAAHRCSIRELNGKGLVAAEIGVVLGLSKDFVSGQIKEMGLATNNARNGFSLVAAKRRAKVFELRSLGVRVNAIAVMLETSKRIVSNDLRVMKNKGADARKKENGNGN